MKIPYIFRTLMLFCALNLSGAMILGGCITGDGDGDADGDGAVDTDSDELSDAREAELGTDPNNADTDGDGLKDGKEVDIGSDPLLVDTDSDGYTDFEEDHAGTDPVDSTSVIYKGGWPYNPTKDTIEDPGWEDTATVGSVVPHFIAMDQNEELVDLYDFAFRGKNIVLDTGTPWCKPCKAMAAYLSDGDEANLNWTGPQGDQPEGPYPWWSENYSDLYRMVQEGELYWVTIIFTEGTPIDIGHIQEWDETYPNEHIPVLFDDDNELVNHIPVTCYPTLNVLNENLEFLNVTSCGPYDGLRTLFP
jgi:thiol-disulfide isomerase/thioredoxin